MGGQRVIVRKPRVRQDGKEVELPTWAEFADEDPLSERAFERLVPGVSTRNDDRSFDEILTVKGLGLPLALAKTLSTTNPIEHLNGSIRTVSRRVKRWKTKAMIKRWVAAGVAEPGLGRGHQAGGPAGPLVPGEGPRPARAVGYRLQLDSVAHPKSAKRGGSVMV